MGAGEMKRIAAWMDEVIQKHQDEAVLARIAREVTDMCKDFPAPGIPL
jgi:glycine/serine hydroxymethyltransferase